MRFLVDMGLSVGIAAWLRSQAHEAIHLYELGLHRLPDPAIFARAVDEQQIVITTDLDFAEIVALAKGATTSVIVFRTTSVRPERVISRLERVLAESTDELIHGSIVVVEDSRHRVRRLPIGS